MKKYYITTPIYYVNDLPHIGHAYTTVAADALARWRRLCGKEVFFLTGTDEHGRKIEQAAARTGQTPQELADEVVKRFHSLWELLGISNDDFIRTTGERHKRCAQKLFTAAFENGDIYPGQYEGWYDVREESFITATRLEEINKLPPEKRPEIEKIKEECFFFRLSAYGGRLLEHYEKNPGFVMPKERMNEVRSFVESGLRDLSISRTTFSWGITVPQNPRHVMYVWFDALSNYLTAAGYESGPEGRFEETWPADLHLVGKDILRFHAVYWPAFLMSAGLPLPERIFAHGWWTVEGEKMSKSLGNVVNPSEIAEEFGVDAFRYFLMREIPFGSDGDFSRRALAARINSDLANGLGNLASRALGMVERYFGGAVPDGGGAEKNSPLRKKAEEMSRNYSAAMDAASPGKALAALWKLIGEADRFVDETKPWEMHKKGETEKLAEVLWTLCETLRIIAVHSRPFMPAASGRLWEKLGFEKTVAQSGPDETSLEWGGIKSGARIKKGDNLFSRVNED